MNSQRGFIKKLLETDAEQKANRRQSLGESLEKLKRRRKDRRNQRFKAIFIGAQGHQPTSPPILKYSSLLDRVWNQLLDKMEIPGLQLYPHTMEYYTAEKIMTS